MIRGATGVIEVRVSDDTVQVVGVVGVVGVVSTRNSSAAASQHNADTRVPNRLDGIERATIDTWRRAMVSVAAAGGGQQRGRAT